MQQHRRRVSLQSIWSDTVPGRATPHARLQPHLSRRDGLVAALAGLAALALYLHTLAPTITFANGAGDSGELAAAAYTLGIPHPTGYPLYILLGFVVTHLGHGEPAFDLNVFSALMGAAASGLLLLLALCLARRAAPTAPRPCAVAAALGAAASFALSVNVWTEAVVTETRTLALALDALLLVLLVAPSRLSGRLALGAAFVYGLALSDHLLSLSLAPAVILLVFPWARGQPQRWLALLAGLLAALSCYLYLPLRAAEHPAANWGEPDTLERFLWLVSGQQYRHEMFGLSAAGVVGRIGADLGLLGDQLNPTTVGAAVIGTAALLRRQPMVAAALLLTLALDLVAAGTYQAPAAPAYLALGALCICAAAAAGWLVIVGVAVRILDRLRTPRAAFPLLLLSAIALFGWAEWPAAAAARQAVAASSSTESRDYGRAVLRSLPHQAVLFVQREVAADALWYAQRALRLRPDVTLVVTDLLTFTWYYEQMRAQPAFDRHLLPRGGPSIGDSRDFLLAQRRTTLLAQAVLPARPLFAVLPEPGMARLCPQLRYGAIFRCVRRAAGHSLPR